METVILCTKTFTPPLQKPNSTASNPLISYRKNIQWTRFGPKPGNRMMAMVHRHMVWRSGEAPNHEREEGKPEGEGDLGSEEAEERLAEELESLEEEAIGGEDEGRAPTDYDRRAHIFYESSRVFRALKERSSGDR